ncbi:redoxin domain-containing protein [bacterium]|jgi:peroxiredoxin|nr:redoxin domain-containing protein [bacterium]
MLGTFSGMGIVLGSWLLSASAKPMEVGAELPAAKPMPQAQGGEVSLGELKADVLVLIVTCNECPVARAYESRFVEFAKSQTSQKGNVALVAINPYDRTGDTLEEMKVRVAEAGIPFPYVQDKGQELTKALGATKTPHVFVFDKNRKLAYHGAFDDNWADPTGVKKQYLVDVVTSLQAGKSVIPPTKPEGCSIHLD